MKRTTFVVPILPAWYLWWKLRYRWSRTESTATIHDVPERSDPSAAFGGTPCKLPSFARAWPAMRWTAEELSRRAGDREVEVLTADAQTRDFGEAFWQRRKIPLRLRELLRLVFHEAPGEARYYLWGRLYPELVDDLPLPPAIAGRRLDRHGSGIWIGQRGNLTSLHYDLYHGLLVQILGRKRVTMIAPELSPALGPRSPFGTKYASSERGFRDRPIARWETILEPGETLYIPPFWWHEVETLEDSISVPVRYTARWDEHLRPGFFPHAYQRYAKPIVDRLQRPISGTARAPAPAERPRSET